MSFESRNQPPRVCGMNVLDDGCARKDLLSRVELKYALPGADTGTLRRVLETNCRRRIYNAEVSLVRSIYFDDYRLSTCRANIDGIGNRHKIRIRWYDRLYPENLFFFEIKWRKNRLTGKHRFEISSDEPIGKMPYSTIVRNLAEALEDKPRALLLRHSEPVAIVEYKREHFESYDGKQRLTLDYDIAFYNQSGRFKPMLSFSLPMPELVIIEGKISPGSENLLKHTLFPLRPRAVRCSKYIYGCQTLGLSAGFTSFFV